MGCVKGENTAVHLFAPAWTIPNRIFNDWMETAAASHESPKSKAPFAALSGTAALFASCRFKKHSLLIIHRE